MIFLLWQEPATVISHLGIGFDVLPDPVSHFELCRRGGAGVVLQVVRRCRRLASCNHNFLIKNSFGPKICFGLKRIFGIKIFFQIPGVHKIRKFLFNSSPTAN